MWRIFPFNCYNLMFQMIKIMLSERWNQHVTNNFLIVYPNLNSERKKILKNLFASFEITY